MVIHLDGFDVGMTAGRRGITVVTAEEPPTTTTGKIQKYKLIEDWRTLAGP